MAWIVVVGLVLGALIASWWSVTRIGPERSPRVSADAETAGGHDDGWTGRGWSVRADESWGSSMVRVTTSRCGTEIRGSGVIVDGVVLTNRHVVDGASSVVVTTSDGHTHRVATADVSSELDFARLEATDLPNGLRLADGRAALDTPYDLVGFPAGHQFSSRPVALVATERGWGYPDPDRRLRLSREVVPGESGSAVVDHRGLVAALVYARASDDGHGLAIDAVELAAAGARMDLQPFVSC